MSVLHKIQRGLLAVAAAWLGAFSLAMILVPKAVVTRALGVPATSTVAAFAQLGAGARLALALVAMVAAFMPKPPRPLVSAIALGLWLGVIGVGFNRALLIYSPADVKPFVTWLLIDGFFALTLSATELARWVLRTR